MLRSGLTGGIGSGKSTVASGLEARGAVVVDVDGISRRIVEPGGPAYGPVVERFGPEVVAGDGRLDRKALAAIVFADDVARADLEAITHPIIGAGLEEEAEAYAGSDRIVVIDIPLLDIAKRIGYRMDVVVVVDTPVELAVARLVAQRGFTESDARARVAAQITREERRALADFIIDNSGDRAALEAAIDRAWAWLQERQGGG